MLLIQSGTPISTPLRVFMACSRVNFTLPYAWHLLIAIDTLFLLKFHFSLGALVCGRSRLNEAAPLEVTKPLTWWSLTGFPQLSHTCT